MKVRSRAAAAEPAGAVVPSSIIGRDRPAAVIQPINTIAMTDRARKLVLSIALLLSGILVALLAWNVTELWILWLLTIGFFCGSALSSPMGKFPVVLCGIAALAIVTTLIFRRLPIYSLDWGPADRIEISDSSGMNIVITDPAEISALMRYGESGHYESMIKSGTNIHMYVVRHGASRGYYVHGDLIGDRPGGIGQTVFVPERDGFSMSIEGILARHGHKK